MKELSIEEKAKAYDEAYKKVAIRFGSNVADEIFLKESEDERIRQLLIRFVKYDMPDNYSDDFSKEECLAWLEKQSEQKPTDKIESKFKVGNWYQCTKDFFGKGVTFDKNTAYYCAKDGCLQNEYGCHIAIVKELCDNFKLWTIKDAKAGDLLADDYGIYIFDRFDEYDEKCFYCMGAYHQKVYENEYMLCSVEVHPATKEQRDLLFQKMKEVGYEWDADKKESKKIEQNPAWSEEDEDYRLNANVAFDDYFEKEYAGALRNWLKSIKERCTWKPSERQIQTLEFIVEYHAFANQDRRKDVVALLSDLKKLKG